MNLDIEERKQAEEGLRQSEERFRLVLDSIGAHVIATTLEGELEFANQPSLDYLRKDPCGSDLNFAHKRSAVIPHPLGAGEPTQ